MLYQIIHLLKLTPEVIVLIDIPRPKLKIGFCR